MQALIFIPILALAFWAVCFVSVRVLNFFKGFSKRIHDLLQNPSPDPVIAFFSSFLSRSKSNSFRKQGSIATVSAFYLAAYGEFEKAREALAAVNWEECENSVRSGWHFSQGVLCYLDSSDFEKGVEHIRESIAILRGNFGFEAFWLSWCYHVYLMIGQMLVAQQKKDLRTAERLLKKLEKRRYVWVCDKIILKWALLVAYTNKGDLAKAGGARESLREQAPHCRALRDR